eukprot:TRINITY_DN393_c2_g3_i1.p1 TRINITY_DN393_c2_g3~~TRINITY_DN393_c2_g3_i1.p1  ORF type:complete len:197 (-),score=32.79 TRINITY_DN393_c2_g3_i1:15-605(-)
MSKGLGFFKVSSTAIKPIKPPRMTFSNHKKIYGLTDYNKPLIGTVVNVSGNKSILVQVESLVKHPLYKVRMKRKTKYMAHDEYKLAGKGDVVYIQKSKTYSKRKHYKLHSFYKRDATNSYLDSHPQFEKSPIDKDKHHIIEFERKYIFNRDRYIDKEEEEQLQNENDNENENENEEQEDEYIEEEEYESEENEENK